MINLIEFEEYKKLHPIYRFPIYKIYGPYQRSDGRRHVIAYDGKLNITISYPKFLMECKLGYELKSNEEVHHKDQDCSNDSLDNYEVKSGSDHRRKHNLRYTIESFICPVCKIPFFLEGIKLKNYYSNKRKFPNRKGPYCSKSCNGKENN